MKRARILYVEINEDGTVGGSHRALLDLIRNLDTARYDPVAIFYERQRLIPDFEAAGAKVHVWSSAPPRGRPSYALGSLLRQAGSALAVVQRCRRFLRDESIDLIHLNNAPTANFEDWLPAAKTLGLPCVTHARGGEALRPGPIGRLLMRRFDRVLPVSDYMARGMREAGIPPALIETVHDGVDIERFVAQVGRSPAAVRAELGVPPERLLAVMVGHLRSWKGQDVVIAALRQLEPDARARLQVVFVGGAAPEEEGYRQSLLGAAADADLRPAIRFAGERGDVPDLMNAADLVLHASTAPEPFGLVVVEGMALGKPVIASQLGGPSEIFAGGDGIAFDPARPESLAAHLRDLIADPERRRAIGEAARKRAAEFSIAATVAKVEGIYEELLG